PRARPPRPPAALGGPVGLRLLRRPRGLLPGRRPPLEPLVGLPPRLARGRRRPPPALPAVHWHGRALAPVGLPAVDPRRADRRRAPARLPVDPPRRAGARDLRRAALRDPALHVAGAAVHDRAPARAQPRAHRPRREREPRLRPAARLGVA